MNSWRELLQKQNETVDLPWTGGKILRSKDKVWFIEGDLPSEECWSEFSTNGRQAKFVRECFPNNGKLNWFKTGYLIGDVIILDSARVEHDVNKLLKLGHKVHIIEPGIEKFTRVKVGQIHDNGPYIFDSMQMPLGPERDVHSALVCGYRSISHIKDVPPALDAAFRVELWRRTEAEKRRAELEQKRVEAAERLARDERRTVLAQALGTAVGRREMARMDFAEAARSALAIGGAEYLDHRRSTRVNEMVVRFRFLLRQFECVCDERTLGIIDSGICLTDEDTGEKGDTFFTLESLPPVIAEAHRNGVLVVFRHVS